MPSWCYRGGLKAKYGDPRQACGPRLSCEQVLLALGGADCLAWAGVLRWEAGVRESAPFAPNAGRPFFSVSHSAP